MAETGSPIGVERQQRNRALVRLVPGELQIISRTAGFLKSDCRSVRVSSSSAWRAGLAAGRIASLTAGLAAGLTALLARARRGR